MWVAYSRQHERERRDSEHRQSESGQRAQHALTESETKTALPSKKKGDIDMDRSKVLLERRAVVDHPAFGWLFENGAVCLMAVVQMKVTGAIRYERVSWQRRFWITLLGLVVRERMQLVLHWVLVHKVYSHVPYFHPADLTPLEAPKLQASVSGKKQPQVIGHTLLPGVPSSHGDLLAIVTEWVTASLASQVVLSLLVALVINREPRPLKGKFSLSRFVRELDPLQFVAKLAIVRVVVDVLFAGGHWVIHHPSLYHSSLIAHKTHHGHNHPSVITNQHFSIADLFVEAYLPAILGLMFLVRGLNISCNPLEEVKGLPPPPCIHSSPRYDADNMYKTNLLQYQHHARVLFF